MILHDIEQINFSNKMKNFESIGCPVDMQDQMIDIVKTEYPDKEYIVVDHWYWKHITITEAELSECKLAGIYPDFIYSDAVLFDSTLSNTSPVISNFISTLVNNCIWVTDTKCFILVNKGKFGTMTPNEALNMTQMRAKYG